MFETAELHQAVTKEEWKQRAPALRTRLLEAQTKLRSAPFPLVLLIAGVEGAGKGETVNLLHEWLDPRYVSTFAFGEPSDEERERPRYWRFWRTLPAHGLTAIYFGSWYNEPVLERALGPQHGSKRRDGAFERELQRIRAFERELVEDGALLVKLWFHVSKRVQRERLKELLSDPRTRWRVTKGEQKQAGLYDRFRKVSERVVSETSTGDAPWVIIDAEDAHHRALVVGEHIANAIERRLEAVSADETKGASKKTHLDPAHTPSGAKTILSTLDLTETIDDDTYAVQLEEQQGRLNRIWRKTAAAERSAVVVFEGQDAAGKGGAIRRITPAIDARAFQVVPIAAPTDEEKAHHYLWRFWRHLPRAGRLIVFDRSWWSVSRATRATTSGSAPTPRSTTSRSSSPSAASSSSSSGCTSTPTSR